MKAGKEILKIIGVILMAIIIQSACGETGGQGSDDPKIGPVVKVSEIIPKDRGEPSQSNAIDMRLSICDPTTTPPTMEEPLTEATMEVTFYNDDETSACARAEEGCPDVYILSYKIEFESDDPDAVPLSPVERDIYYFLEAGDEVTADNLILMPWKTKKQFMNAFLAWGSIVNYTVKITFKGEDEFGQEFEFHAQTYVGCGDWLVCD